MLVRDVALWRGNRRKMEIAECRMLPDYPPRVELFADMAVDLSIPIAVSPALPCPPPARRFDDLALTRHAQMMRYRGKFQRSCYPVIAIDPSDEGKVLEEKWQKWYELEGWKRQCNLAAQRWSSLKRSLAPLETYLPRLSPRRTGLHDTVLQPIHIVCGAVAPLPCPKTFGCPVRQEFKMRYLELGIAEGKRALCLGDMFRGDRPVICEPPQNRCSVCHLDLSPWILVSGREYRQLNSVFRTPSQAPSFENGSTLLLKSGTKSFASNCTISG